MHSDHVKNIVAKANVIVQTGDVKIESNEARNLVSSLLLSLCSQSTKNPYFAIAVYQHLTDKGFIIDNIRGEALHTFMSKFGKKLFEVDDNQRSAIRQIADRLFSPTRI